MGKFTGGIGMTDVAVMMKAIESMHDCHVEFHVRTLGKDVSGYIATVCDATFQVLPDSDLPKKVWVEMAWPNKASATYEGMLYNLLWQLDYAIQKEYEQMPLTPKE